METPRKRVLQEELENPVFLNACLSFYNVRILQKYIKKPPKTNKVYSRFGSISVEYIHKDKTIEEEAYRLASYIK